MALAFCERGEHLVSVVVPAGRSTTSVTCPEHGDAPLRKAVWEDYARHDATVARERLEATRRA